MRKNKVLVCDLENTLVEKVNIWALINKSIGNSLDQQLYNDFVSGRITYAQWCEKLSSYHSFLGDASDFDEIGLYELIWNNTKPYQGAKEMINAAQNKGYNILLISGGVEQQVALVKKAFGIKEHVKTNVIEFENNAFKIIPCEFGFNKERALKDYLKSTNPDHVIAVGDSDNDVTMLESVARNNGSAFLINPSNRIIKKEDGFYAMLDGGLRKISDKVRVIQSKPPHNYETIMKHLI